MSGDGMLAAVGATLPRAWSFDTSSRWTEENPARGQCSVTALVAGDLLGGDILRTRVGPNWHFYNRVGGVRLHLTAAQFGEPIPYDDAPSSRDEAMTDTSPEQYEALSRALARLLPEMAR